jgi:hypothetical protein
MRCGQRFVACFERSRPAPAQHGARELKWSLAGQRLKSGGRSGEPEADRHWSQHIERAQRLATIMSLRVQGWSLAAIGQSLSPRCSAQAVHKTLKLAIQRTVNEAVEQVRRLEALRLDELTVGVYEKALGGDLPAIDRTLQIMARRARLLGLDAQPVRSGANEFDQPLVKIEVVGGEAMAHAEQVARAVLGLGPHLA